jgi:uncharacterized protein YcfJ
MKNLWASACLVLATLCTTPVMADASGAVVGGAVGSAIGAVIGHDINGRHGAIVGAAIGGATGAAIGSDNDRHQGNDRNQGYSNNTRQEKRDYYERDRPVVVKKVVYVNERRGHGYHRGWQHHHRHHHH